jgi:phosphocarrier protein
MNQKILKQVTDTFIVTNKKGIHARPSTELARKASIFKSEITLHYQELKADAKSLVGVLMLNMSYGQKVVVEAVGEDAEEAVRSIIQLAKENFHVGF